MISYKPCKKCGCGLPIIKGSAVQCPYCGSKTLYMESMYSLKYYLSEILDITLSKTEKKVKNSELERRKSLIESFFYNLNSNFNEYRHLIITKLDDIEINPVKLFNSIRAAGNFEIIVEEFLIPHIKDIQIKRKYEEFRDRSYIINKSLLGLYYSYLAKNSLYLENCANYYQLAETNYQNIVDYINIINLENSKCKIYDKKNIYIILSEFAAILREILNRNPKYYSDKLEDLLEKLINIKADDFQKINLYTQIEKIYQLERNTSVVLEKVKIDCPLLSSDILEENIIFNKEENLEKLDSFSNWIKMVSEKYQNYQRNLLKLHSGKLVKYLELYREEFINYKNKSVEKFNSLLEAMIIKAFDTYNSEAIEVLTTLSDFIKGDVFNENIIERFEIEHKDLIELDDLLKNFITDIFKKPLLHNFKSEYCKKLISLISVKHTEFDEYILKYINRIFQNFEEIRSRKVLSLEEQKHQFSLELKPNLQKLINLSFNLNEKALPYPLFIDIKVQDRKLKLNNSETITILIENPNLTDIKDIKIYFFMPNSFHSKLQSTSIKKLRANESKKIKTKVIPKKVGAFLYMVMAEYQHSNKTFWMPSIKLELEVERIEEIVNYSFYQVNPGIYRNALEAIRIQRYIGSYIC
ncbi:MAG: hypothetical protein ACFE9Q_12915 [Candidatus Hodarchaeota archaeon]